MAGDDPIRAARRSKVRAVLIVIGAPAILALAFYLLWLSIGAGE